jgi:flagellar protein FlaF
MASNPQMNYRTPPPAGNSREIEAWGLTEAALRMRAARDAGDKEALLGAVRLNWRLWTLFQADLLGPECVVPEPVRGNLVALAAFIDRHTLEIIADTKPEKIDILISINRELAMGLFTDPEADKATPVAAAPADGATNFNISA